MATIRAQAAAQGGDLGAANFNLTQALNNLYVAQAAKAAADKASQIAFAYGASSLDLLTKGSSSYVFQGCNHQVYPSITGTVAVSSLISSGAVLNSGHILTWGDCTDKTQLVSTGSIVTFTGTFSNGVINADSVKVVTQ